MLGHIKSSFFTQNFCELNIFDPNFDRPKIIFDPKFFSYYFFYETYFGPKIFLTQNFLDPIFFGIILVLTLFWTKIVFGTRIIWDPTLLDPKWIGNWSLTLALAQLVNFQFCKFFFLDKSPFGTFDRFKKKKILIANSFIKVFNGRIYVYLGGVHILNYLRSICPIRPLPK